MGPATTIAIRCHTVLRLKEKGRSAESTLPFTLIDHLYIATQGQQRKTNSVLCCLARSTELAKADGETLHLDTTATGHPKMAKLMNGDHQPRAKKK